MFEFFLLSFDEDYPKSPSLVDQQSTSSGIRQAMKLIETAQGRLAGSLLGCDGRIAFGGADLHVSQTMVKRFDRKVS